MCLVVTNLTKDKQNRVPNLIAGKQKYPYTSIHQQSKYKLSKLFFKTNEGGHNNPGSTGYMLPLTTFLTKKMLLSGKISLQEKLEMQTEGNTKTDNSIIKGFPVKSGFLETKP